MVEPFVLLELNGGGRRPIVLSPRPEFDYEAYNKNIIVMTKEIERIGSKITPKRTAAAIGMLAVFGLPAAYAAGAYTESYHQNELATTARKTGNFYQAKQWELEANNLDRKADFVVDVMRGASFSGAGIVLVAVGLAGSAQYRRNHAGLEMPAQTAAGASGPHEEPSPQDVYDALAGNQARPLQTV